jgi:hypothetical protein
VKQRNDMCTLLSEYWRQLVVSLWTQLQTISSIVDSSRGEKGYGTINCVEVDFFCWEDHTGGLG